MGSSHGGMILGGNVQRATRDGAATFAIDARAVPTIGAWNQDLPASAPYDSVRQNLDLIVADGKPNPALATDPNRLWGFTGPANHEFVWRSGAGILANGALVWIGGPGLSISTLADLFVRVGAVRAMQLDINHEWVQFNTYKTVNGAVHGTRVLKDMRVPTIAGSVKTPATSSPCSSARRTRFEPVKAERVGRASGRVTGTAARFATLGSLTTTLKGTRDPRLRRLPSSISTGTSCAAPACSCRSSPRSSTCWSTSPPIAERVVSKEELLDTVWGDRFVSESTLTSRIKAARRAVGDDGTRQSVIATAHGRGYRMVVRVDASGDGNKRGGVRALRRSTPSARSPLLERDEPLTELDRALEAARSPVGRVVWVAGEAGIGKSTLARLLRRRGRRQRARALGGRM